MSRWRHEALQRLPELQRLIASTLVDNPMMLWIELMIEFHKLCKKEPLPLELLQRIWNYALWCMRVGHPDVQTAAALAFCEHLLGPASTPLLPQIMSRQDYMSLRELLLYHNSEQQYVAGLQQFPS